MYEADQGTTVAALQSLSTTIFTSDTISKILALATVDNATVRFDTGTPDASGNVTVAAGTEVVLVTSSDTQATTVFPPPNAPVVIFQGKGGVVTTLNDSAQAGPVVVGKPSKIVVLSPGADTVDVGNAKNVQVIAGEGDRVILGSGDSTVLAGDGNSTVLGGTGHSIVQLKGNATDYSVKVTNDGHAIVTKNFDQKVTDISKIQYVQLDAGKALVFANDTKEAAVTTLYEATFGRTADSAGLQYWFDQAKAGRTLTQIANDFVNSAEYKALPTVSNEAFVTSLYLHTFGRAPDADGLAYWTGALQSGGASRAKLVESFADIASHNIDGTLHTEAVVIGSVTIVHNIV